MKNKVKTTKTRKIAAILLASMLMFAHLFGGG